jgi:hypothetical protein
MAGCGLIPAPTTLPTRLSTAAATHGLFRAYHPARRAAVVAPARIAVFSPSTVRAPSQRRPPPAASKPRVRVSPNRRLRSVRIARRLSFAAPPGYQSRWERSDPGALGRAISGNQEDLAKIQGLVEQALDAWRAGRLVVRPGEFASGWVEIFPQLDEFGRDILDLPGFSTDGYRALGGTSSPHILESRPGDDPRSLPKGIPETDVEGIPVEPAPEGRGLPIQGPPDTWVVGPRGDRLYGPDGKPIKDVDWGHDHGQGQPHTHEWIDGERQPGRPATEDESFSGNGRGDDGQIKPEDWK